MKQKVQSIFFVIALFASLIISGEKTNAQDRKENIAPTATSNPSSNNELKTRIMIVSSYHREYIWSQETNDGLCAALLEFGYLDNKEQVGQFSREDFVESSKAIIKKAWMDTKKKSSKSEIGETLSRITPQIDAFQPDIILLGDDNAANYLGNHYLDAETPVVFWGINGLPLKYGIIDSLDRPGHNVTGVYQKGYHVQGIASLQKIVPGIKTIAVLSDDSPTGRAHAKKLERYGAEGTLPVIIIEIVITNSFEEWQAKALELQPKVDAFYVSTHNTFTDKQGKHVDYLTAAAWYFRNINKPSTTSARFFVVEGFFSTVEDSAFRQGYEALKTAHTILAEGGNPAEMAPFFPAPGPFIVNRQRAKMLGLEEQVKENAKIIDEYIDTMMALEKNP